MYSAMVGRVMYVFISENLRVNFTHDANARIEIKVDGEWIEKNNPNKIDVALIKRAVKMLPKRGQ